MIEKLKNLKVLFFTILGIFLVSFSLTACGDNAEDMSIENVQTSEEVEPATSMLTRISNYESSEDDELYELNSETEHERTETFYLILDWIIARIDLVLETLQGDRLQASRLLIAMQQHGIVENANSLMNYPEIWAEVSTLHHFLDTIMSSLADAEHLLNAGYDDAYLLNMIFEEFSSTLIETIENLEALR
ncbi:MAG: hypothetical protein FWF50_04030 [Defluviitaleaceae bacterium]|nr:hypothetical protein [Defluviitaleaceae bacterium]